MPITVKTPKTPEGVNALFDQLATAQMEFNKVAAQVQKHTQKIAAKYDPVLTGFKKRIVPGVTSEGELSLGAVYLLLPHLDESKPTEFRQLTGLEGALGLMGAVYSPETIVGELAVRNLDFATRLAARVPVRLASYYRTFENLPTIRDAILRDFDEVSGA